MKELDLLTFPLLADRVVRPALRCFGQMVWPIAIPMVAVGVFIVAIQSVWLKSIQTGEFDSQAVAGLAGFIAAIFVSSIWSMLCMSAISIAAIDLVEGRPASFWRCLRRVVEPRILGTLLLATLIHLVGLLFCGIGILVTIPLLFVVVPVMIEERLYGAQAVARSIELVRFNATGRWADSGVAHALGLTLVGYGLSSAVGMVVQLPFMLYQQYYMWDRTVSGGELDVFEMTQELSFIQMPVQAVNVFAQLFGLFYLAIAGVVLYREIRRRREGNDLEAAIPRILLRENA